MRILFLHFLSFFIDGSFSFICVYVYVCACKFAINYYLNFSLYSVTTCVVFLNIIYLNINILLIISDLKSNDYNVDNYLNYYITNYVYMEC